MTDDVAVFDVVVVGSLNLDLVTTTERHPAPGETVTGIAYHEYPGGKGLNQAVAAARAGARVALIGRVGDDAAGSTLTSIARDAGIDVDHVLPIGGTSTGRAAITVDAAGENSIIVVSGANAELGADLEIPPCRVLLVQLETPMPSVVHAVRAARGAGATTVLDPAPAIALPDDLVAACSIVAPNEHEVELIGGADDLLGRGARTVVVTAGGDGVHVQGEHGPFRHDAFPVEVVDTTGAGDAFRGAFAARLAGGHAFRDALRFATAAGALATSRSGAVPSLPRLDEIEALLARH